MAVIKPLLRDRLLAMADHDQRVRSALAAAGVLFDGYHPEMQAVHDANAAELDALLGGAWPSVEDAGRDGQDAAWKIVQHAIGHPELQRTYLKAIGSAVAGGRAPGWQAAMLEDRIRCFEGRLQLYGTQFDSDEQGQMAPLPIEDLSAVDVRRAAAGLSPLAESAELQR